MVDLDAFRRRRQEDETPIVPLVIRETSTDYLIPLAS